MMYKEQGALHMFLKVWRGGGWWLSVLVESPALLSCGKLGYHTFSDRLFYLIFFSVSGFAMLTFISFQLWPLLSMQCVWARNLQFHHRPLSLSAYWGLAPASSRWLPSDLGVGSVQCGDTGQRSNPCPESDGKRECDLAILLQDEYNLKHDNIHI